MFNLFTFPPPPPVEVEFSTFWPKIACVCVWKDLLNGGGGSGCQRHWQQAERVCVRVMALIMKKTTRVVLCVCANEGKKFKKKKRAV